jgi:hypothetical protein
MARKVNEFDPDRTRADRELPKFGLKVGNSDLKVGRFAATRVNPSGTPTVREGSLDTGSGICDNRTLPHGRGSAWIQALTPGYVL